MTTPIALNSIQFGKQVLTLPLMDSASQHLISTHQYLTRVISECRNLPPGLSLNSSIHYPLSPITPFTATPCPLPPKASSLPNTSSATPNLSWPDDQVGTTWSLGPQKVGVIYCLYLKISILSVYRGSSLHWCDLSALGALLCLTRCF